MREVSEAFGKIVTGSHEVVISVDAWYDGALVARDLPVVSGSVEYEEEAFVQGRLTLQVAATPDLIPTSPTDPLAPYGQELHVRRGIRHPDGNVELVSLGWFRIQSSQVTEAWNYAENDDEWQSTGASVAIEGYDRASTIVDAKFMAPEKPQYPTSVIYELKRLTRMVRLGEWSVNDTAVPDSLTYDDDRAAVVVALAAAMSAYAFMDRDGLFVVRKVVQGPKSGFTARVGPGGNMTSWSHTLSRDETYNGIVARGQATDQAPVQAILTEGDGPTRWDGPFGNVPLIFESSFITSAATALYRANSALAALRTSRDVEVEVNLVPNPALEVGDTITVITPRGKVDARLSTMTIPLSAAEGSLRATVLVTRQAIWNLYGDIGA